MFNVRINNRIKVFGRTDYQKEEITLNLKKGDVVNTIIHENLHAEHPEMDHPKVYSESRKIEGNMSLPEMAKLLLDTHERAQNVVPKREITYTQSSKVVTSNIK